MSSNYEIASHLELQADNITTATLLTCIGCYVIQIHVYDRFQFKDDEEQNTDMVLIIKFEEYCVEEANKKTYMGNQEDHENVDTWYTTD